MTFEEWWEQVEAYGLGLPEGYVLVPVKPTAKMLAVGRKAVHEADIWEVYQAMIQAAQDAANDSWIRKAGKDKKGKSNDI